MIMLITFEPRSQNHDFLGPPPAKVLNDPTLGTIATNRRDAGATIWTLKTEP